MNRLGRVVAIAAGVVAIASCDNGGGDDVCARTQCIDAPAPKCEGSFKITYQAIGTCRAGNGVAICEHPPQFQQDCAGLGKICQSGQCVDPPIVPCEGITCLEGPAPDCDGNIAQIYESTGTCDPLIGPGGECVYPVDATLNCTSSGKTCRDGACIDPADFPCDPNPCNVPPLGICEAEIPKTFGATGTCVADGREAQCTYPAQAGAACRGGETCHVGACATNLVAPSSAGALVITEIMRNPVDETDLGEWFELENATDSAMTLDGCTLSDDQDDSHMITPPTDASFVIPARGHVVLGRSGDPDFTGGFVPDYVFKDFILGNGADEVIVTCGGVMIDRVAYAAEGWPTTVGSALVLSGVSSTAAANDNAAAWCEATRPYGNGDNRGTPRQANPNCPQ